MGCGPCKDCGDGNCGPGCDSLVPETPLPSNNPVVVFDGDCRFCRRWMRRYWNLSHLDIAWSSYQSGSSQFPGISEEQFRQALHVIEPDGTARRGAAAFFRLQQLVGLRSWPLWLHEHIPPFRILTEAIYRFTARHRSSAEVASKIAHGQIAAPSTFHLTRRVFLRCLGLIYLMAFLSAGWQLDGLVGGEGIRPVGERLDALETALGFIPFGDLPTLLWFDSSDAMLQTLWIVGAAAAGLLMAGLLPMAMLAMCWIAYLSITNGGDVFFLYQWDALLLEVGFVSIFWAPFSWRLNAPEARRPSTVIRLMLLWLLARFMFFSGFVKLQSGDPTWLNLTALEYHYWTQPLPTWTAWYLHQAAAWFQKACCLAMLAIELGAPLLVFGPRVCRSIAFALLVALQIAILATGNYGFFNLLSIVLCMLLLDDAQWMVLWPKESRWNLRTGLARIEAPTRRVLNTMVAVLLLSLSVPTAWSQWTGESVGRSWREPFSSWRLVNQYGLFRSMTTTRPELRIEVSEDGANWETIVFHDKPGPLDRPPAFCLPDMPRLDWQMWFDGLSIRNEIRYGTPAGNIILTDLLQAILEERRPVLGLMESTPDFTPRFIRWRLDRYRFSNPEQRAETGDWWVSKTMYESPTIPRRSQ